MAAARWAWEHGEAAGAGTGTLPQVGWTFWPLQGVRARAGRRRRSRPARPRRPEDERFVLALLDQGAVALERAELAAEAVESRGAAPLRPAARGPAELDQPRPAHAAVDRAGLGHHPDRLRQDRSTPEVRADLLQSIREEAERLNRYVGDLLDMTRLEGGGADAALGLDRRARRAGRAAVERVARRLGARRLERDFPPQI